MAECIICDVDAGEGFDTCMACRNKHNVVTIGKNHPSFYIYKILELGVEHNEVIIKTIWSKLFIFNHTIKLLLGYAGWREEGRRRKKSEKGRDGNTLEVYYIKLEKHSVLKGIKKDLDKQGR